MGATPIMAPGVGIDVGSDGSVVTRGAVGAMCLTEWVRLVIGFFA